jgi:hypothetical protein
MLYFGRVGSSWRHRAFFGSSWGKKVITPKNYIKIMAKKKIIIIKLWFLALEATRVVESPPWANPQQFF